MRKVLRLEGKRMIMWMKMEKEKSLVNNSNVILEMPLSMIIHMRRYDVKLCSLEYCAPESNMLCLVLCWQHLGRVFNILRENNLELAGDRRRPVIRPPQVSREGTKKAIFANLIYRPLQDVCIYSTSASAILFLFIWAGSFHRSYS
ncbi:hypothetical protein Tsubulata_016881 [Turnera subulata]|uniref:Uncharacterized protein n=1 Tax=Turnera subulata TaxID=218843 RepID=A0A9Q0F048_9ROSI|nr:hypothetical protein Tsubulata_016881 [Turnera subulata]